MIDATMPPGKLRRLVNAAYVRCDESALIELREWADSNPQEAAARSARDGYLRALLADTQGRHES